MSNSQVTYRVLVMDRGRPITRHLHLDRDLSKEVAAAYVSLGWPENKILIEAEEPAEATPPAAA